MNVQHSQVGETPEILFHDNHCLVVKKPGRWLSAGDDSGDVSLLDWLKEWRTKQLGDERRPYVVPVHFLDRPVSGVMIYACSSKGASRLAAQFRQRTCQKSYLALVEGNPPQNGTLVDWIEKDRSNNISHVVEPIGADLTSGKRSSLHFRTLARRQGISLLLVTPETGRSHQIRLQLAHQGWPILGDCKYGSTFFRPEKKGIIALHAWRLSIRHPTKGHVMNWDVSPPRWWAQHWPGRLEPYLDLTSENTSTLSERKSMPHEVNGA